MSESLDGSRDGSGSQTGRLVVSWLVVGIPLAYGLWQTITSVMPLFAG
ncbi:MFS transporter small subunit [Microbacterium rhizophilus]